MAIAAQQYVPAPRRYITTHCLRGRRSTTTWTIGARVRIQTDVYMTAGTR